MDLVFNKSARVRRKQLKPTAMLVPLFGIFLLFIASTCVNYAAISFNNDLMSIFLRLYYGDSIDKFTDTPLYEVRNLLISMDRMKPTVLYIHGYTGSVNSRDTVAVVTAYLERNDHNVLAMDWSRLASKNYPSVVNSAKLVGYVLAGAVDELVDQGLQAEKIHVVGHSMGAQVAGYLGRQTSFELSRITGLDPAGPFFNMLEPHLMENDAKFVDTIHTDSGFYGISHACGTVSFYPNGGRRVQPGCPHSFEFGSPDDYCSHHRSWVFYAESLRNETSFIGTNCNNYRTYACGNCDGNMKIPMGYSTPTNTRGVFYLRTRNEAPFGMQMEGASATKYHAKLTQNHLQ